MLSIQERYPSQDDPDYWKKVPLLFEEEFDSEKKFEEFKTNWIIYRVPIYVNEFYEFIVEYVKDYVGKIIQPPYVENKDTWFSYMTESVIGHTKESYPYFVKNVQLTSNNEDIQISNIGAMRTIKAHQYLTFNQSTGKKFTDYDVIVEIGVGVGEFGLLIRETGFEGDYYGVDFTPMCKIADHYMKGTKGSTRFVNHISELPEFTGKKVLFIGTWSFSEVPIEYRREIIKKMSPCDWLIVFQREVFGINNKEYFYNEFKNSVGGKMITQDIPWHPFQGGNKYLIVTQ